MGNVAVDEKQNTALLLQIHYLLRLGWHRPDGLRLKEALLYSDFVAILRCEQKISPYISSICGVDIFCSRLVSLRTRNKAELPYGFLEKPRRRASSLRFSRNPKRGECRVTAAFARSVALP
jgi:hypothetical protein